MKNAFAMRALATFAAVALALSFALPSRAAATPDAGRRVAFVVGNGAYKVAPALENPGIDAHAVAASLKRLGFEVIEGYDLDLSAMRAKVSEFSAALPDAKAALIYYAGHGVSVDEENYLLPTDINLKNPSDLDLNAIGLSVMLKMMRRQETVNVVILDACRDNPFAAELAASSRKTRSVVATRGLAPIDNDLAKGTLIAFATDPKTTALDGRPGDNSPFTKALLAHIEDPGVPVGTVMDRVRSDVFEATNKRQTPWVNTSIIGEFFLNPVAAVARPAGQPGQVAALAPDTPSPFAIAHAERKAQEEKLWESAEKSNLPDDYKVYLDAYPAGTYAQMAKNRIAHDAAEIASRNTGKPGPAALAAATPAAPAASPATVAAAPVAIPELKAEIGTLQTEKALGMRKIKRIEVQMRLVALEFDPGETGGAFTDKTRAAIAAWQKQHGLAQTSFLGPSQLAALTQESESQYRRLVAARAATPRRVVAREPAAEPVAPRSRKIRVARPEPVVAPQIQRAQRRRAQTAPVEARAPRAPAQTGEQGGIRLRHDDDARQSGNGGGPAAAGILTGIAVGGILGGILSH